MTRSLLLRAPAGTVRTPLAVPIPSTHGLMDVIQDQRVNRMIAGDMRIGPLVVAGDIAVPNEVCVCHDVV